jgi:hypothetical protein
MKLRSLPLLLTGILLSGATLADEKPDENRDLDLIPQATKAPPAAEPSPAPSTTGKIYLENAFTQSWLRGAVVPFPPPQPEAWQERLLLDVRKEWRLGHDVSLNYSGRLNLRADDGLGFPNHENVTNDLREAYASWEPWERTYLDAGRINLKSGVALGFNPTDFFKTRAVAEALSADPNELRNDRLGTLMLRAQHVWAGAALTAAYAPAVASPSRIYTNADLRSFDPMLDRTNAQDRWLLKGSVDIAEGFSPELLAYHDNGRTRWGVNLAESLSQSVVGYLEWSGGPRQSLIADALRYGRVTGTLPPATAGVLPTPSPVSFRNELAVGASYTTDSPKITFNLEFHYNQAGFSRTDWDNWFRVGSSSNRSPISRSLWYIRNYAVDQQEVISRRYVFLRADWVDAFIPKLELSGFVDADLLDGSERVQLSADYYLSDRWTVGGVALVDSGARHSNFGSLPQAGSVLLKVARYF